MKEYLRYFRFLFAAVGVVFVLWLAAFFIAGGSREEGTYERTNTECTTKERVFDYGNVLTDAEENKLREQITEREKQIGADIVLVTLNESLKEYAQGYDENAAYSEFTMIYADNFYDEHKFGYNKPVGDGILLLDNSYREDDGKVYTWLCTTGKVQSRYSTSMIDRILDAFYEKVDTDPYLAYKTFVDHVYLDMTEKNADMPWYVPLAVAVLAAGIYVGVNIAQRGGKKTTDQRSYINGGQPKLNRKEDIFLHKHVTKMKIETSSGGGGGSHVSSSGASHGGGGHSR